MRLDHNSLIKASLACVLILAWLSPLFLLERRGFAARPPQDSRTLQETRGKQIYLKGAASAGGEILAYIGDSSVEMPGTAMPCANCHGLDGKGRPEGGVVPSNLTWEALTKPYGVTHPNGRKHPPYTERALALAIVRGLDPAGNKLLSVMPRYQMPREDLADLIAYLKRLGEGRERGISEDSITIGTIVPTQGPLAALGEAVKAATTAYFDEINSQGGIYNRKVNLKFVETAGAPEATCANVRRFIQEQQVFALTSALTGGADAELASLMNELEVPLVGPLTLQPQVGHPLNRYVFYLLSGLDDQARALVSFASQRSSDLKAGVLIVFPESAPSELVVKAISDQCRKNGCGPVEKFSYQRQPLDAATLAGKLSRTNKNAVFFLGAGAEALALIKEADELRWAPTLYFPGGVGGNDLFEAPPSFNHKLLLSLPASPADQTIGGISEFRAIASKYGLPPTHLASQTLAFSAAKILVEGMQRSGKDLTVENLIGALEQLDDYQTGLTPPVSYGPNRRLGALGAYVVAVDLDKKSLVPASSWVKIN